MKRLPYAGIVRSPLRRDQCAPIWICLAVIVLGCISDLRAAPPPNDLCSSANVIPNNGPFPHLTPVFDISSATTNGDPVIGNSFYDGKVIRSVWFSFTPAITAEYTISSCLGPDGTATTADTVMGLYTSVSGCSGPFALLGGIEDQTCGDQAAVSRVLLADTKYFIVVWKFCEDCTEDGRNQVQLKITAAQIPPNDICTGAIPLQLNIPAAGTTAGGANNFQIANTNVFAGVDQIPSTAPGRDVVYSFVAPQAGNYSFRVSNYQPQQDLVVYVSTNCPAAASASLAPIAVGNRSLVTSAEEAFCVALAPGQQAYVIVDDAAPGNAGSPFTIEVSLCLRERESNDSPIDAGPLIPGIEGSIFPGTDRDFFALGSYPPGWRAFVMAEADAARSADLDLRITTYSDTIEYDDNNNDPLFRDDSPNIAGALLPGGPVFAFVRNKDDKASEPYRIYAVVQPPLAQASVESEPNNSTSTANTSDRNYFYGNLNGTPPSTDVDVFAFNVTEGDLIFLSLDGDPHRTNAPINAKLELLDSNGNPLVTVNDPAFTSLNSTNISLGTLTAIAPMSPGEAILYRSPVEGTFYARVSISPTASGPSAAGRYLLSISRNGKTGVDGFNHPPALSGLRVNPPVRAGRPATLTGTIWDTDVGDTLRLVIRWGDGSTNVFDYPAPGRIDFAIPHTYTAPGTNLSIELSVLDSSGLADQQTLNVNVLPPPQPARFTAIGVLPNGHINLRLEGTPDVDYRIEYRNPGTGWLTLGVRTANAAGLFTIVDTAPNTSSRFYRAAVE